MAHWYLPNGTRFAPLKKDGTPYQVITRKMAEAAGAVVGVTDILKYCGDKGWMSRYFSGLAIDATISTSGADDWKSAAELEFRKQSEAAAAGGTKIHDLIDSLLSGKHAPDGNEEETLFRDILSVLDRFGVSISSGTVITEGAFYVNMDGLRYGGTRDFRFKRDDGKTVLLDWKTTVRPRGPRIDELAQIASYTPVEDRWETIVAADVYISQKSLRVTRTEEWSKENLMFGWEYFLRAYRTMMDNLAFDEMIR